jgi:hypothetical protein
MQLMYVRACQVFNSCTSEKHFQSATKFARLACEFDLQYEEGMGTFEGLDHWRKTKEKYRELINSFTKKPKLSIQGLTALLELAKCQNTE